MSSLNQKKDDSDEFLALIDLNKILLKEESSQLQEVAY